MQTELLSHPEMPSEEQRLSRREHQKLLATRRKRMRRKRRIRVLRIKALRGVQTARFWTRAGIAMAVALCIVFWAKFAFVYDLPAFMHQGSLINVEAYVTVKPWWFGPPMFDLQSYLSQAVVDTMNGKPYDALLTRLGEYQSVVSHPVYVWIQTR